MRLPKKEYNHYLTAVFFSLGLFAVLAVFVGIYGKDQSFLMINGHYTAQADYFFNYWTLLGEWILWAVLFGYALLYKRNFFIAVLAALIVCTLLTRLGKQVFWPGQPRPLRLLKDAARAVPLLKHNAYENSFPSGHTSTAFTTSLLLAYLVNWRGARFLFPLIAFGVGYSRVYLAQHFVTDVMAGIIVGVLSSYGALLLYEYLRKKKNAINRTASAKDS